MCIELRGVFIISIAHAIQYVGFSHSARLRRLVTNHTYDRITSLMIVDVLLLLVVNGGGLDCVYILLITPCEANGTGLLY